MSDRDAEYLLRNSGPSHFPGTIDPDFGKQATFP